MRESNGHHDGASLAEVGCLLVDSKPMAREMAHAALIGRARSVRQTTSVDKAIEIITAPDARVDCIVADWDMPPVGGLELLRMIRCRALPNVSPRTSVVIFTSRAEAAAVRCAVELDANGFATSPLSLDKLVRTIGGAVSRTWHLQEVAHYASVPCVVPPSVPAEAEISSSPVGAVASRHAPFQHVRQGGRIGAIRMYGLHEVRPGAILARDIRDVHGTLLLRTGTALEPALLNRLRKSAGAGASRYHVWVRT